MRFEAYAVAEQLYRQLNSTHTKWNENKRNFKTVYSQCNTISNWNELNKEEALQGKARPRTGRIWTE